MRSAVTRAAIIRAMVMRLPLMAAVAIWKKVESVGHSPPGVGPQSLQLFFFICGVMSSGLRGPRLTMAKKKSEHFVLLVSA